MDLGHLDPPRAWSVGGEQSRWFIHENVLGVKELVTSTSFLGHSGAATE